MRYIANDNTIFENEQDCLEYENTAMREYDCECCDECSNKFESKNEEYRYIMFLIDKYKKLSDDVICVENLIVNYIDEYNNIFDTDFCKELKNKLKLVDLVMNKNNKDSYCDRSECDECRDNDNNDSIKDILTVSKFFDLLKEYYE